MGGVLGQVASGVNNIYRVRVAEAPAGAGEADE